jgi:membrane protease YdiL (CAAX protease family)
VLFGLAALINATTEEYFWRGALLPRPDRPAAALAVVLFGFWHLTFVSAQGVAQAGGAVGFLIAATVLGTIWMESRLKTGTLGFGILTHAGVNLFAFITMYVANVPAA